MSAPLAIEVNELSRSFVSGRRAKRRTVVAVDRISLSVERGERLAFIGPNGAGKSTSIKMLTGILHPSSGSATVLGLVPWTERRQLAQRIGTLFGQRSLLWQELTPRTSYRMLGAIFGLDDVDADRRVCDLGELLDAADLFDRPVRTLSLGQRMRCELAACLLHEPDVLFLDEPTIGLDLLAKQAFRELLVRLNGELNTTIVLTSHDIADIEQVAERTVIVNHGRIIYDAPVTTMRATLLATKRIEVRYEDEPDIVALRAELGPGVTFDESRPGLLGLDVDTRTNAIGSVVTSVLELVSVVDLSVVDPPLEQLIGDIYQRPAS